MDLGSLVGDVSVSENEQTCLKLDITFWARLLPGKGRRDVKALPWVPPSLLTLQAALGSVWHKHTAT